MPKYILITANNGIQVKFFDTLEAATEKRNWELMIETGAEKGIFTNEEYECDDFWFDRFEAFAQVGGFDCVHWRIIEIPTD